MAGDDSPTRALSVTLIGCALFGISLLLPVMRWRQSEHHSTGGSARVFLDDSYTLVDGGFGGAGLVPVAALAVAVVAVASLAGRITPAAWYVQAAAALVALYYPFWVLVVFLKKLEDEVLPGEGIIPLVVGFVGILWGTWSARPLSRRPVSPA